MSKKKDSTKVYKILSYIGILWIVGLFVQEKDDESVKFHVGQGMLVTIVAIVISLINDLVKNLNINDTSLLRYKYSHLRSNEELYSFLMRKGYSIEYIHDLIKEIKEELYVELKNELDYQKVYELSRMLNLPNSKEKVINYLIENYTVEGINRLTNILNR